MDFDALMQWANADPWTRTITRAEYLAALQPQDLDHARQVLAEADDMSAMFAQAGQPLGDLLEYGYHRDGGDVRIRLSSSGKAVVAALKAEGMWGD